MEEVFPLGAKRLDEPVEVFAGTESHQGVRVRKCCKDTHSIIAQ